MSTSISFDRAVNFYDQTRGFPVEEIPKIAAFIAQKGELTAASKVLEIGVGTARVALPLSKYVGSMFGVDVSYGMVEHARKKPEGIMLYLTQARAEQLPMVSQSFDTIILVHILHLVSDLDSVMSEIARVLRPNGKLIHCWNLDNPVFQEFHKLWNKTNYVDSWSKSRSAPQDYGWKQIFSPQTYAYPVSKSPQQFVDEFKNRIWSSTWNLSEQEVARNAAIMQDTVNERFADPSQPLTLMTEFVTDVYAHPAEK